jgi:hypothetical protein
MRTLTRILAAAVVFAAFPLHAQDHAAEGTKVELKAVPEYVRRLLVPVLPSAVNTFRVAANPIEEVLSSPDGYRIEKHLGGVSIAAPAGEKAAYARVRIGGHEVTLTLVNLVPYPQIHNGFLDGYRLGEYRILPLKGLASYDRPKGFIRLSDANRELWVSDHYRMRDFQCKLDGNSKFLVLRVEALLKLEILQHELETKYNVHFDHFTIMSGYRTPFYNAMIGNETSYSRHLYGDAMDVFIDTNHDGAMDDLNGDGKIDANDARFLLRVAELVDRSPEWGWLKGGAGVYHATRAHGPFLHVDARGYVARWGV